jgi:hypothetical protein
MFCPSLDLNHHIQILERNGGSEHKAIETILPDILATIWQPSIPPWKIVILPLSPSRCFIAFGYSHGLADGISGIAFHRTFLEALQDPQIEQSTTIMPELQQIYPPFDTATNLPISWSFLLSPLFGHYLPAWLASFFGLEATSSPVGPRTWVGAPMFHNPGKNKVAVRILSVDVGTVEKALAICRAHQAKLTGLLHYFIVDALSVAFAQSTDIDNVVALTAINMRGAVGISNDTMGNLASGDYRVYSLRNAGDLGSESGIDWALVKSTAEKLAMGAKRLHDQPIGLLRYVKQVKSWVSSKIGKGRDGSYELSNLGSFQPPGTVGRCSITEMVFSQPANVIGAPLDFNVVGVADGPLTIVVSWQIGALGLEFEKDELEFVAKLCTNIEGYFARLIATATT